MKVRTKRDARHVRQLRVRKKVRGTDGKPRLCIYKSLKFTYAQLISDQSGVVLAAASSKELTGESASKRGKESARLVGLKLASLAKEKNISQVTFDRNGYIYHGRVSAVAQGAREGGLEF